MCLRGFRVVRSSNEPARLLALWQPPVQVVEHWGKAKVGLKRKHGVSKRTVHRMVESGELTPSYTMPTTGAMLFDAEQVARVFAARTETSAA